MVMVSVMRHRNLSIEYSYPYLYSYLTENMFSFLYLFTLMMSPYRPSVPSVCSCTCVCLWQREREKDKRKCDSLGERQKWEYVWESVIAILWCVVILKILCRLLLGVTTVYTCVFFTKMLMRIKTSSLTIIIEKAVKITDWIPIPPICKSCIVDTSSWRDRHREGITPFLCW